jgi:predicted ester cyclase
MSLSQVARSRRLEGIEVFPGSSAASAQTSSSEAVPTGGGSSMATNLTTEQMKTFVRDHFEEFVNKKNAAVIHKNMSRDFYDHDGPGGKPTGLDGDEQMMLGMYKAMPDLHLTIEDMIAEADKVMCRNVWRWSDSKTGKRMAFHGFVLWRFEGDKIAERWATVTQPAVET